MRFEFSPLGFFLRGIARYNDNRPDIFIGAEVGVTTKASVFIGRFEIKVEGIFTSSMDPSFQTDLPNGTKSKLAPDITGGINDPMDPRRNKPIGLPKNRHELINWTLNFHF